MIDFKTFNRVSQLSHFAWGALFVLVFYTLLGFRSVYVSFPVGLIAAGVKEFWYDENYETSDVRGSNLEDFSFYTLGVCFGLVTALAGVFLSSR